MSLTKRRARRAGGAKDRGAVAVEAALVTPIILMLVMGILEFGMLFKDWLSVVSAVRAGARTASAEPRVATFAQDAANQVAVASTALNPADIQKLWVYKADAQGYPLGGGSSFTSCTQCVTFRWDAGSKTFIQTNNSWAATSQNACPGDPNHDTIGIYLETNHPAMTGMFFSSITMREHTVMALEPLSSLSGCR